MPDLMNVGCAHYPRTRIVDETSSTGTLGQRVDVEARCAQCGLVFPCPTWLAHDLDRGWLIARLVEAGVLVPAGGDSEAGVPRQMYAIATEPGSEVAES